MVREFAVTHIRPQLQQQSQEIRLFILKWTSKLAALVLALSVWASPVMACMISGTLTEAERECCEQMADNCGSSTMPDSHSCCNTTVQQFDPYLANSRFDFSYSHPAVVQVLETDFHAPAVLTEEQSSQAHSPPASPPGTISVLKNLIGLSLSGKGTPPCACATVFFDWRKDESPLLLENHCARIGAAG